MYIINSKLHRNLENEFRQLVRGLICVSRCIVSLVLLLRAFVLKRDKNQAFYCLGKFVLNSKEIFLHNFYSFFVSLPCQCFTPPWYNHVCKMTQWLLLFCYKKNCLSRLCHIFASTFKLTFGGL